MLREPSVTFCNFEVWVSIPALKRYSLILWLLSAFYSGSLWLLFYDTSCHLISSYDFSFDFRLCLLSTLISLKLLFLFGLLRFPFHRYGFGFVLLFIFLFPSRSLMVSSHTCSVNFG